MRGTDWMEEHLQTPQIWELEWESSEGLCFILAGVDSFDGMRVIELGCGAFAKASVVVKEKGALSVLITDGEAGAVDAAMFRTGLSGKVFRWDEENALATTHVDLVIGSDLWYEAEAVSAIFRLVQNVPRLLFSSPRRQPFLQFAERIKSVFQFSVCEEIAPPSCEQTLILLASCNSDDPLVTRLASLIYQHRWIPQQKPFDCSLAPPPPPPPPRISFN